MNKIKSTSLFLKKGFSVLRNASNNRYNQHNEAIEEIRKEMMGSTSSTPADDKRNLMRDKKNVAGDCRRAYEKIALSNG